MILDRAAAKKLVERVLKMASAKDVAVRISGGRKANTRFANNEVTSCGDVTNTIVTVTCAFGRRHGSFTTNQIDDASLNAAVSNAEELARLAPENPEYLPPLGAQKMAEVTARDPKMAGFGAAERQKGVEACLGPAREQNLVAAGFFESSDEFVAAGNNAGAFAFHAATDAGFSTTVRTTDGTGSGWAQANAWRAGDVDWPAVARRAVDKAQRSARPRRLEPGRYTVVLEPAAVAAMLGPMRLTLNAREADEGRSFFSKPGGGNRVGERIFSDKVTIVSDPNEEMLPSQPFDAEGVALKPTTWIENGVLKNLVSTRYWANRQGRATTGAPSNFIVRGGSATLEELVKSTDRGILVTRFFYVRFVDPQTLLLTGLTRDGTFWIEKGEIAYPVNNFRFNESPATLFANAEALSAPVRVGERMAVPAIKASAFNMAGISAAV